MSCQGVHAVTDAKLKSEIYLFAVFKRGRGQGQGVGVACLPKLMGEFKYASDVRNTHRTLLPHMEGGT